MLWDQVTGGGLKDIKEIAIGGWSKGDSSFVLQMISKTVTCGDVRSSDKRPREKYRKCHLGTFSFLS